MGNHFPSSAFDWITDLLRRDVSVREPLLPQLAWSTVMDTAPLLLVIEDDHLLQETLRDALKEAGYDLVFADNGTKALSELENDATRFSGMITDIRLGSGPDGWAVAQRARELSTKLPLVYMSGDSAADWASKGVPNSVMIQKPYAIAQIVTAISALITAADTAC